MAEVSESLQQLGMRACPVCGSAESLGMSPFPVLIVDGEFSPGADDLPPGEGRDGDLTLAIRVECIARYGHPVPGRVLGRISRTRSARWWMAAFGNLRWCCGALQSARTGRRLLVRTGAESTYAIGSRVPSMAAWATSVRRRLWLRA
jgi:hypothetical protein